MNFQIPSKVLRLSTALLAGAIFFGAAFAGVYTDAAAPTQTVSANSKETGVNNRITAVQADEMALALTNKMWVWDWVAYFVPYMSENGLEQIVSTSKSAEWAGALDYSTMNPLKTFSQTQVNSARKEKTGKAFLTKSDIDAHAQLIMQSNGQWGCIDFMLPYMTENGINQVRRIYVEKHGEQPPITPAKATVINLSSGGKNSITVSDSFEAKKDQILVLTIQSNIEGGSVDLFLFSPSGKEQRITIEGSDKTETIALSAGNWAYNCTGSFKSGTVNIRGQVSVAAPISTTPPQTTKIAAGKTQKAPSTTPTVSENSSDAQALDIMQRTGNWKYIEAYLPKMTNAGIDKVVSCYNSKHINANEHKKASDYYN